ncbi:MAG: FtsX-like permease family protein [Bacillota bacterium]|nr:FtsX-like permease family protein [Bacillota bacterium]
MLFKLSFRNARKSFKDYATYFATLTLGITIFYLFNSIDSQTVMLEINSSQNRNVETLIQLMSIISIFVSAVLGFLVIYSSNFMIKRRKKEFGVYLTLGMDKSSISKILFIETFIVGLLSLISGLILGIVFSHGFSIITAKMFEVNMKEFHFIFSKSAALKAIVNFGIIFLVVIVFNTFNLSKLKIIDLIYGDRKNQELKIKSVKKSIILFILSVLTLSTAYYTILKHGLLDNKIVVFCVILGSIGTFLFFVSMSGIFLMLLKKNKTGYYKDLNIVILKHIQSRINTSYFSMTVICLLLFMTIGVFSTGSALGTYYNKEMVDLNKYDATLQFQKMENKYKDAEEFLKENDKSVLNHFEEAVSYNKYKTNFGIKKASDIGNIDFKYDGEEELMIPAVSINDYNKLMNIQGKKTIDLNPNEYIIVSNMNELKNPWGEFLSKDIQLNIADENLKPKFHKPVNETLSNAFARMDYGNIVVHDTVTEKLKVHMMMLSGNYKEKNLDTEYTLEGSIDEINKSDTVFVNLISKRIIYDESRGISTMFSYIGIYLGIVFLLTGASIVSLQQLAESTDNYKKFELLKKLGTGKDLMSKALFKQIFVTFMIPLGLAAFHSIFGLKVVSNTIEILGNINLLSSIAMTAGFIILFYGTYFIFTYLSVKRVLRI